MALSKLELAQLVEETSKHDPFRTWRQRDDQMYFRSLYVKHDPQLEALGPMYQRKLARIIDYYDSMRQGLQNVPQAELEEALLAQERKIRRIAEKMRDVEFEIRGRGLDQFKRNPIGTEYYIDLDGGNNSNDGLSPEYPWLTIQQYTTTSVRSAGDIAWVRAGTSQVPTGDIVCDEDGTRLLPIYIIGCSDQSGEDPWGDAVTTKPEIDFNGGAYTFYIELDHAWYLKRLNINSSNDTSYDSGNVAINTCYGVVLESCIIQDRNAASSGGARVRNGDAKFIDCDFQGNRVYGLYLDSGLAFLYRCRFNGGVETQDYGLHSSAGQCYCQECEFGQDSAHDYGDVSSSSPAGMYYFRACVFNDLTQSGLSSVKCFFENCSGGPVADGAQAGEDYRIEKVTDTLPSGKSGYSLKITPLRSLACGYGMDWGLALGAPQFYNPLRLWLAAGTYNIKVKVRAQAAWGTYPTAEELFLRASYYDDASVFTIAEVFSDEVLSDGSTWVDFEVDITTGQDGPVYLDVILDKYEAGPKGIYVYPFPEGT